MARSRALEEAAGRPFLLARRELPRSPQQQRSLEARQRLKAAALDLFGTKGYEATSVGNIAKKANVATGGFYQHFRSKRHLLVFLMDELLEALSLRDFKCSVQSNKRRMIRDQLSVTFYRDFQFWGVYRAWHEASIRDPEVSAMDRDIRQWTTKRLSAFFHSLHKMPGARTGVNIHGLAVVMDSFFWSSFAQTMLQSSAERDQWLDAATHLIHHALFYDEKAVP